MLVLLLSEEMDPFYQNVSSFPTVVFTFVLLLMLLFWLVAVLGWLDIEFLDVSVDMESLETDSATVPDGVAGLILRLSLHHVPLTISLTLIALFGWFISYYSVHFLIPSLPQAVPALPVNAGIFVISLFLALKLTALCIRPLRPLFERLYLQTDKVVIGQTAIVRTSRVDEKFGEAVLDDGGAGLILKVRASRGERFARKDRVVLLEYHADENCYLVIAESEFLNYSKS